MHCHQSCIFYRISEVFKSNNSSLGKFVIINLHNKHEKVYKQLDPTVMNYYVGIGKLITIKSYRTLYTSMLHLAIKTSDDVMALSMKCVM